MRLAGLIDQRQYQEAFAIIDKECVQLLGLPSGLVSELSTSELIAILTSGEVEDVGREKCSMVAALLKEAGAIHAARNRVDESYGYYLTALNLLLEVLLRNDGLEMPDYAPTVKELVVELKAYILPVETSVMLLHHYEQIGAYAKAEDTLFKVTEDAPGYTEVIQMGIAFYKRLQHQSNDALVAGNLPRNEVEAGLEELRTHQQAWAAYIGT